MQGKSNIKIHLQIRAPKLLLRQTPHLSGRWGDCEFVIGARVEDADFFVAVGNAETGTATNLPKNRRIFFVTEPPGIINYSSSFLDQFAYVVSPYRLDNFTGKTIISQPALRWWFGNDLSEPHAKVATDYDELVQMHPPAKGKAISAIVSSKTILNGHQERLDFLERAKRRLGDNLDIFGRGFSPIPDKAQGLLPYKYHLVLENNCIDHFWTEKTADSYLGFALPFFSGCSNLQTYFFSPKRAL